MTPPTLAKRLGKIRGELQEILREYPVDVEDDDLAWNDCVAAAAEDIRCALLWPLPDKS